MFGKDIPPELENLLNYFETRIPGDEYTEQPDMAVEAARKHEEWRREFMKWYLDRIDAKEEGREEGRIEGIQAFIQDNLEEGRPKNVIIGKLVRRLGIGQEEAEEYYSRFALTLQTPHP